VRRAITRRGFLAGAALAGAALTLGGARLAAASAASGGGAPIARRALSELAASLKGRLILPGDHDYDAARRVASFNPATDKRPAMIVRCGDAADVVRAVAFARSERLEVAVRAGGHDVLGESVCNGGMLIDVSHMKALEVDSDAHVARAGAGLRAGEFNAAVQPRALAAALGCNPAVGIAGLTLGGGLGWFLGRYGAACDNLLSADVVTADARSLRASAAENADLFWALRGGGGNFGIVTRFELRLHPVGSVLGGYLAYRGEHAREFLRFYRDFMAAAPDGLVVELNLFGHGEPTVVAIACYAGDAREGERVLAPMRSFGPPIADTVREVAYAHLTDRPSLSDFWRVMGLGGLAREMLGWLHGHPGFNHWKGGYLPRLSDAAIDSLLACTADAPAGWSAGIGHYMHGAVCRVAPDATPLVREPGGTSYFLSASWRYPGEADESMAWVDRSFVAIQRFASKASYINYLSSNSADAVRASYGPNYDRLVALKNKYDPTNFFHLNRNIRPSV
jgi:FAD/FMN-containing dehydrogenase